MKYLKNLLSFGLAMTIIFWSCKKIDLKPELNPIAVSVNVSYDTSKGNFYLPLKNIGIKIENLWNNKVNQSATDDAGNTSFGNISAGVYNIAATITIPKDEFNALTGQFLEDDVTLNATLTNVTLNNTLDSTLKLKLELGRIGGLVIKQIYYAGSHTKNGASFRDQFIEIYNNSNDTIYADSLYIAQVFGSNTKSPDYSKGFYITSGNMEGQYDWSKSIGMPAGVDANNEFFYPKSLYRIPGNGTDYPMAPGTSIVLAQTAVNHKAPYSNSTGGSVDIKDPSLTIDLSNADFEVYLAPYMAKPLASDVDNPAVPDLIMLDYFGKDWLYDSPGRDAFAIFYTDVDIPSTYEKYPNPTVLGITSSTTLHYQIPNELIMDAVEIQPNTPTSRVPKKLQSKFDAGFTFCPAGGYSSQSVIRKTLRTIGGRIVLMDTNNSTNDFDFLEMAEPKAFK